MFGILKKKLSKAVKSISEKFKDKEKKAKKTEKKVEEKIEKIIEVEEKIEDIIEEPEKIEAGKIIEEIKEPEIEIKPEAEKELKKEVKKEIEKATEEIKAVKEKQERKSLFKRLITRAAKKIIEKRLTEDDLLPVLNELETSLIEADVAVAVAEKIKNDLLKELVGKEIKRGKEKEAIVAAFKKSLMGILSVPEIDLKAIAAEKKPVILLFLGFNGSGKTTSIAKLANWLKNEGFTCVLAAADTFRAASLEQLEEHADKIGVKMIKHKYGADPAAVVYDAVEHAKAKGVNFVLADTAGRVHTNKDLIEELKKIVRVDEPDLKILVLDSMTGNDILPQSQFFNNAVGIDAIIFTKMDVNPKGGSLLTAAYTINKPILFIGNGQHYDNLEKYNPQKIVNSMLE